MGPAFDDRFKSNGWPSAPVSQSLAMITATDMGHHKFHFLKILILFAGGFRSAKPSRLLDCYADSPVKDYIVRCDFNDDAVPYCDWVQPTGTDNGDWSRTKGSDQIKPSTDHPAPWEKQNRKGYYIYPEASNLLPKETVRLESQPLKVSSNVCVEFSYYMYSSLDHKATLRVLVRDGPNEILMWNRTMPQSHAWLSGAMTIPGQAARSIRVIFEALKGQSQSSYMALDNIAVTTGPCFSCTRGCDFDGGMCGWTSETYVGDEHDYGWQQWIGRTDNENSGPDDDFSKPGFGSYMLLESASNKPGHKFHLTSPAVVSSQCLSLTFYYYLYGTATTMAINVYTKQQGGAIGIPLLSIMGNQGKEWRKAEVVHCGLSPVQFVIEAVRGETAASDIAVDKICIFTCSDSSTSTNSSPTTTPSTTSEVLTRVASTEQPTTTPSTTTDVPITTTATVLSLTTSPSTATTGELQSTTEVSLATMISTQLRTTGANPPASTQGPLTGTTGFNPLDSTTTKLTPTYGSTKSLNDLWAENVDIKDPTATIVKSGVSSPECSANIYYSTNITKRDYLVIIKLLFVGACNYIMRCDFNDNMDPYCHWIQKCDTDDGEWIRTNGETPSQGTGPSHDYPAPWGNGQTNGHYIYHEASNFLPKQSVRLESPAMNVSGDVCVEFSYHMYGLVGDGATLNVLVRDGPREALLWNRTLPQSIVWLSGAVTVPVQTYSSIRVIFEAVRGLTERGDIGLDNVAVITGPCFSCISGCNFDEDKCGWSTETYVGDADDEGWTRGSNRMVDFSKPGFGSYMLLKSASNKPGHKFHLTSPAVVSSQCLSLTFYYYLYGTATTMAINVYTKQQGSIGRPLLNIAGNQGQNWTKAQAVYCGVSPVQFIIEGVSGDKMTSELGVDKVCIVPCTEMTTPEPTTKTTTPEPITGTTPGPITDTTAEIITDTTAEIITDTTPEPITDTTAEIITDTTPEPITDTTPEPITDTTAEIITDTTPGPITDTTPEPITDTTAEIITDTTPEPTTDTTAEIITDTTPEPITDTTPEPITDTTPETITDTTPGPITDTTPGPITDTTPETITDTTPEPITDTTAEIITDTPPEPITGTTPETITDTTAEIITDTPPEPITGTTPETITGTTPEPITGTTPEPITDTTAEIITDTTPGPITDTTAEIITDTTPEPITDTTPEPITDTTPETITDTTPGPITDTTPGPITDTTPETITDTTPEPITDTTAEIITDTPPEPITGTTPETITDTTPETITDTTPGPTTDTTPGPTTDTTPGTITDTTPGPTTDTTPGPTTDTTPGPTTDTTPGTITDTTPDPTTDTTPGPTTDTTPGTITDTTPGPTTDTTPGPTTDTTPGTITDTTPGPTTDTTPGPTTDTTPGTITDTTPGPTTDTTPGPTTDTTPGTITDTTPGPTTDTTPGPTTDTTPGTITDTTPGPTTDTTPGPTTDTTPGTITDTTPGPTTDTTPGPTTDTTPGTITDTTPGPTTDTTPGPTTDTTPGPTTDTTPGTITDTTPGTITDTTPGPTTDTTPGTITDTTPGPTTDTTPGPTTDTTPGPTTGTTPEPTTETTAPGQSLESSVIYTHNDTITLSIRYAAFPRHIMSKLTVTTTPPALSKPLKILMGLHSEVSSNLTSLVAHFPSGLELDSKAVDGSCIISGDPHYITFDNRMFTFLGTCTYTLARTCHNNNEPWFSIEGKNEERGLPGATYLRKLYVTVDNITITLMKNRRILVGETRIRLPKRVGRIHLSQSGQYVMVETDFGLQVQYDGNHFVKITLSGSYSRQMCGLCGDFNGNYADDYQKPDGTMAANDTLFGDSWKTKDDEDQRCKNIEPIPCEKDIYDKVISTDQCGLIIDPTGPFRDCVKIVDPIPYFNNCVYDMCQFQGFEPPLCDQLQAYTDACQSAGATVHNWRTPDFCTPPCPPNSHYDLCASTCPGTCVQPNRTDCSSKCIEGCDCDPGYVLSDSMCVPLSECGCTDAQDDYHLISESWYLPGCTEKCTCISPGKTECRRARCSDSEICALLDGIYGCHPKGHATCSASGDPHYKTFDKVAYDFMGNCTYTFSKLCNTSSGLPYFNVETSNEHRGRNTRVSYVKAVHVDVYGHRVTIMKNRKVNLDGRRVSTPIFVDGRLVIRVSGGYISLETDFGLWVRYDGNHHVDVTVPSSYAGQLCGLCGNYNGIKSDDDLKPDGDDADNPKELGASWLVPGTDTQCSHEDPPSDCDKDEFEEPWSCGLIKNPKGPFRECNKQVPAEQHFEDCVYDLSCGPGEDMPSLCFALQTYAALCAQAGVPVTWRNKTFCPVSCPAGSHYEPCGTACPASCTDLSAPSDCSRPCVEGCVCNDGYVLSGAGCVPFSQCGCVDPERNYRLLGENWITNGNCTERCTCSGPSNITCEDWECGPLERCGVLDGVLDCHTSGHASCHVAGDPHYYTFDNAMHTFLGTCTYTLVTTCDATMVTPFTISAKNEERGLPYASYLSQVHIEVYGLRFTMQKSRRLLLNDKKIRTPFENTVKGVNIYASGIYVVLETKFGLMVRFDGNHHLEIRLPNTYYGKVCGMCGNFNNHGADELLMPNGLPAKNVTQFGNSWQIKGDDDSRCRSDDREDLDPMCSTAEEKARWVAQCQELLSAKYQKCHGVIKPAPFIENCVYDLCMYAGMVSTLCDNIQSYVEACKSEDIDIKWRTSTFCPLPCQKDSHYTECASACPATCTDIYAPSTCESNRPCVEGCECDSGFVLSDDRCVALADCGCVDYNDDYHESGDSWLNEHCNTKCTCTKGQLRCKKHSCGGNSVCALKKDGRYKCTPVSFETCLISGDPHYLTFDGLVHHFQGEGTYTLVTTFQPSETLQPIYIAGKNEERNGNDKISYLSAVYIDVYGHSIEFHKNKRFVLDNERVKPPYKSREGFQVYQKSKTLYLETEFGLSVNFDGRENADIIIPSLYKKQVRGLCGNYDGKFKNDFTLPDGTRVSSLEKFGNSWEVDDRDDDDDDDNEDDSNRMRKQAQKSDTKRYKREDVGEDTGPEPETGFFTDCTSDQLSVINSTSYCGAILDPQGPFRDCHRYIEPETYYQNCLFDLCQFFNNSEMLCAGYEVYAQVCQVNGTNLPNWRVETRCAMACPPHSSYRSCMAACPPTCANLAAPSECDMPCLEGCECDRGFVYSDFDCVPYSQCGCTYQDKYYEVGQMFITDDCTEDCKCNTTETVQCSQMRCPENTICTIINSVRTCGKIWSNCSSNICQNGGTCVETVNGTTCVCPPFYGGQNCENSTNVIIVAVVVVIVVILVIAGAALIYICCCRDGRMKSRDRMSDTSSLGSSLGSDIEIQQIMPNWQLKGSGRDGGIANPEYKA
ncbi:zonadhesin-like [Heterodontus francisci]|uniref:zonadhesin-like n=1 Tax=Heterodontus francisci TaxID=7792 RepID=UPI00355C1E86